jgi:hypothetical protein
MFEFSVYVSLDIPSQVVDPPVDKTKTNKRGQKTAASGQIPVQQQGNGEGTLSCFFFA